MRKALSIALLAVLLGSVCENAAASYGRRRSYGRRGGGGFGGTAASAAAMGYAQILRAQSQANLTNSQAAINWEKAKTLEIQNRLLWTETYFKMRETNHEARLREEGPRVTGDQAIAMAKEFAPRKLAPHEFDPVTGRITYPEVLRDPVYDSLRHDIDGFFAERARTGGSIDFYERQHVRTILTLLHDELRRHVGDYDAQEYGHAATFIESLLSATHDPS